MAVVVDGPFLHPGIELARRPPIPARPSTEEVLLMSVEDALPPPSTLQSTFPRYSGQPGFAEIKPHNIGNIRAGLDQLRKEFLRRSADVTAPPGGPPKPDQAARVKPDDVYLLTYDHHLSRTSGESKIIIYILRPRPEYLTKKEPHVPRGQRQAWMDGLGLWWSSGNLPGPEYSLGQWQALTGPVTFGSMIEPFVRREFFKKFGQPRQHLSKGHRPSSGGSDVDWLEVAEFLYELAAELGEVA
jgi:hypothetical protein